MIGRRSFLKVLGAAPAAAAAPAQALQLAGMPNYLGSLAGTVGASEGVLNAPTPSGGDGTGVAKYLLANGVPPFVREAMRRERRIPQGLDPDLAVNRSFSLAAKVAIQRERNLDRACSDTIAQQRTTLARRALSKTLGFDFWW